MDVHRRVRVLKDEQLALRGPTLPPTFTGNLTPTSATPSLPTSTSLWLLDRWGPSHSPPTVLSPSSPSTDISHPSIPTASADFILFENSFHRHATARTFMECRRILRDPKEADNLPMLVLSWSSVVADVAGAADVDHQKWQDVWVDFLGQYYGSLESHSDEGVDTWITRRIF